MHSEMLVVTAGIPGNRQNHHLLNAQPQFPEPRMNWLKACSAPGVLQVPGASGARPQKVISDNEELRAGGQREAVQGPQEGPPMGGSQPSPVRRGSRGLRPGPARKATGEEPQL